jgi:hypothetical protein
MKDSSGVDCVRGVTKEIVGKWIVEGIIYFLTIAIRSSCMMIVVFNIIDFNVGVRRGFVGFLGAGSRK